MSIEAALRKIRFYAIEESLPALLQRFTFMAERAGDDAVTDKFARFPSFIPAGSTPPRHPAEILIDIGGTSTKVAVRRLSPGQREPTWLVLFESPNDDFQEAGATGTGLLRFARAVAERTEKAMKSAALAPAPAWGLGIVWSNAMINRLVPGEGVHGQITSRKNYTKGEWFNADSKDGDSVSVPFCDAFTKVGLRIATVAVANDTPFTMKALVGADGGMVASTGMNATLVSEVGGSLVIHNAEMGTTCRVTPDMLSAGDRVSPGVPCTVIEQLIAGKFLPQTFAGHILALAKAGVVELTGIAQLLEQKGEAAFMHFQTADLSHLVLRPEKFSAAHPELGGLPPSTMAVLRELSQALILRAAKLAGLIAVSSVANQFSRKSAFTIALDSRLAREIPIFWAELQATVQRSVPSGKSAKLVLVDRLAVPGGALSVPMLGAAHALDSLYGG